MNPHGTLRFGRLLGWRDLRLVLDLVLVLVRGRAGNLGLRCAGRLLALLPPARPSPRLALRRGGIRCGLCGLFGLLGLLGLLDRGRLGLGDERLLCRFLLGVGLLDLAALLGRRAGGLPRRGLPRRLLGLRLRRQRLGDLLACAAHERRVGDTVEHALDAHLHALADERCRRGDANVETVELADGGSAVVAVDLHELDLELGVLLDRRLRCKVGELPFCKHDEVVEVRVRLALEEEAPLRHRLELAQPRSAGSDQRRCNRGR